MKSIITYSFGVAEIYDDYIIMVMNEGVNVTREHNKELVKLAENTYAGKKFGYITHRKHSYSVDPRTYTDTSKIKNLVAFAVVSNEKIIMSNVELEKLFLKKPIRHFEKLEDAILWVETKIAEAS